MGSVSLERVEIRCFRNHEFWEAHLSPGLTILEGENATGKTNALEAIEIAVTGGSFRSFSWEDLVLRGEEAARVVVEGDREGSPFAVSLSIDRNKGREHRFQGARTPPSTIAQKIPTVTFTPDDLSLTKGTADQRRNALDRIGERLSPAYKKVRREYSRIIKQRNRLLRDGVGTQRIEPWDIRMAEVGAALAIHRARLLSRVEQEMSAVHERMGGGEELGTFLDLSWSDGPLKVAEALALGKEGATQALSEAISRSRHQDRERMMTTTGPHRDDVVLTLEGRPSREFASQGQHRALALSWKIAEVAVVDHVTGYTPILLLDDVMSELDARRRKSLAQEVVGHAQAIVTTTNIDYFDEASLEGAAIVRIREGRAS